MKRFIVGILTIPPLWQRLAPTIYFRRSRRAGRTPRGVCDAALTERMPPFRGGIGCETSRSFTRSGFLRPIGFASHGSLEMAQRLSNRRRFSASGHSDPQRRTRLFAPSSKSTRTWQISWQTPAR